MRSRCAVLRSMIDRGSRSNVPAVSVLGLPQHIHDSVSPTVFFLRGELVKLTRARLESVTQILTHSHAAKAAARHSHSMPAMLRRRDQVTEHSGYCGGRFSAGQNFQRKGSQTLQRRVLDVKWRAFKRPLLFNK